MDKQIKNIAELAPETSGELQQTAETPTENTAEVPIAENEIIVARKGRNPQKPNEVIEIPAKKK